MRIDDIILAKIDINLIIQCKYNQIYIKLLHSEIKSISDYSIFQSLMVCFSESKLMPIVLLHCDSNVTLLFL